MKHPLNSSAAVVGASLFISLAAFAATPPALPPNEMEAALVLASPKPLTQAQRVQTSGGAISFRWDQNLMQQLGVKQFTTTRAKAGGFRGEFQYVLQNDRGLDVDVIGRHIDGIVGGEFKLAGGVHFQVNGKTIDLRNARAVVRGSDPVRLDFISADGKSYVYGDKIMYEMMDEGKTFRIRSMDLAVSASLAKVLGDVELAGRVIADVHLNAPFMQSVSHPKAAGNPNWPGENAPTGTYATDVFMETFSVGSSGSGSCRGCDGPGGALDGEMKYTPSSTLRNNPNAGSLQTVLSGAAGVAPGNGLGQSTVLWAADTPWYDKFTSSPFNDPNFAYPYLNNDVHPNLIWNMYRIDNATGALTQIGRSGMKHAFLTTNTSGAFTCDSSNGSHVLGKGCGDTYGVGNNNNHGDLGPRNELIASRGVWGRCGSVFDPNCDGVESSPPGDTTFANRMLVRESMLEACRSAAPTAKCWMESWYVVRDDVNIYNTMATRGITPNWSGTTWTATDAAGGSAEAYMLGSAIERWVAQSTPVTINKRVDELEAEKGHAKVGVRVRDLGDGTYRYDYAVMNFDYSRAFTNENLPEILPPPIDKCTSRGREDNHTLCVIRNDGFDAFTIALGDSANIISTEFADGDIDTANDWAVTTTANSIRFAAPDRTASLNWGSMLRFSVIADKAPVNGSVVLDVTEAGSPSDYGVNSFQIGTSTVVLPDALFQHGFEDDIAP